MSDGWVKVGEQEYEEMIARIRQLEAERDAALDALRSLAALDTGTLAGSVRSLPLAGAVRADIPRALWNDVLRAAGRLPTTEART